MGHRKLSWFITFFAAVLIFSSLNNVSAQGLPYVVVDKDANPAIVNCQSVEINLTIEGKGDGGIVRYPVDVMLVIDNSVSMRGQKLADAKTAAKTFIDQLNSSSDRSGLVSFNYYATLDQGLTYDPKDVEDAIDDLVALGKTNIYDAITTANTELTGNGRGNAVWAEILLSDGDVTAGGDPIPAAEAAAANDVVIYTIGLGEVNKELLKQIADITGGKYYYTPNSADLEEIYLEIAEELLNSAGTDVEVIDILPDYVEFLGGLPAECNYNGSVNTITCNYDQILIGETKTIQFNVNVNQLGHVLTNEYPASGVVTYTDYGSTGQNISFPETYVNVTGYEGATENCSDGIDNDCDGYTDCDDPDCASDPVCITVTSTTTTTLTDSTTTTIESSTTTTTLLGATEFSSLGIAIAVLLTTPAFAYLIVKRKEG